MYELKLTPEVPRAAESTAKKQARPGPEAIRQALVNLRKRGFNRLYQAGRVFEFSTPEDLLDVDFSKPVYVLVDRLVLSPEIRSRLMDSIEICYREGRGEAILEFVPEPGLGAGFGPRNTRRATCRGAPRPERLVFNERFDCKKCGTAYQEPEPRLFSFNNPYGACPRCQGFGNTIDFDLDRVIPDKSKSLADGAIEPWTKPRYRQLAMDMRSYARDKGIPLDVPFRAADRRAARRNHRRRPQGRFPRREGIFRLARAQEIQTARARFSEPLSRLRALPGLPRHAAARRSSRGENRGPLDHRSLPDDGEGRAAVLPDAAAHRRGIRRSPTKFSKKFSSACDFSTKWASTISRSTG